jgi:hypothetical protein
MSVELGELGWPSKTVTSALKLVIWSQVLTAMCIA